MRTVGLRLLPDRFAVCRLPADAEIPAAATAGGWWSVTRTANELSVVCREDQAPPGAKREPGWRCLELLGPFEFSAKGVIDSVVHPLAAAGVSVFTVATFDTDYLLVQEADLARARTALTAAGHTFAPPHSQMIE